MPAVGTAPSFPMNHLASTDTHPPTERTGRVLTFDPTQERTRRPRLTCALAPQLNPRVAEAHEHSREWVVSRGLVASGDAALQRCLVARFAWLGARTYPHVSREELCIVSDWLSFLFFYDDLCDTRTIDEDRYRQSVELLERRLIEIAHGEATTKEDEPLAFALADILVRLETRASAQWLERFADHFEEYIEGVRWERHIRVGGRVPGLPTYARLRLLSSAVFPCFDLAGIFIDGLDGDFADDVYIRQLEVMANDYVSWVNDIYGIDKEIREQTTANLVVVLAEEGTLGWDDALDYAIEKCNAELNAFLELKRVVEARSDHRARAYVAALESWMRGNLDWYAETQRYRP